MWELHGMEVHNSSRRDVGPNFNFGARDRTMGSIEDLAGTYTDGYGPWVVVSRQRFSGQLALAYTNNVKASDDGPVEQ
jgi:hypothetical protein